MLSKKSKETTSRGQFGKPMTYEPTHLFTSGGFAN